MQSVLAATLLLAGVATAAPHIKRTNFNGPADPARFKFYTTPSYGGICDMDTGPDGYTLWYQDLIASKMGVLNTKNGQINEYEIPYSDGPSGSPPFLGNVTALQCVVRTGKDGMVYGGAGTRNEIVQVNPNTNPPTLKIFAPKNNALGNLVNFNDAWGADEGLYFSQITGNKVTLFNYKTEEFTSYPCPSPAQGPLGMRTDKNQNLWFTDFIGQQISKLDGVTKDITEFPLPDVAKGLFPEVLRASTNKQKYLWANAFGGGGFIRITPATGALEIFTNPDPRGPASFPFENDNDYCGRVWYTSVTQNLLVYYDTNSGKWTNIEVPGIPLTGDFFVAMHRGPLHSMWFTELTTGKIGQYILDSSCTGESS